ncbi:MAG: hypothetical protein JWQ32_1170 [Marmoricola sp.]|nr:hypothetical protein [Marmoricola sp.]
MPEESDQELIARSRTGDRDAYAVLYERYNASGLRFATTLTGDPARAGDLVNEAFIKIMALLDDGRGPDSNFNSYLLTSIRNVMIDDLRRHRREELVDDVSTYGAGNEFVRDHAADQAESTVVNRAFASLPERWREVLWYTEVLDESLETVAARFGVKANAVGVLSWRAREGFRQAYLAEHLAVSTDPACVKFAPQIPRYVRNELTPARTAELEAHLAVCEFCPGAVVDLERINSNLGALLVPVALLGLVPGAHAGTGVVQSALHGVLVKATAAVIGVAVATTAVASWVHYTASERPSAARTAPVAPAPTLSVPSLQPPPHPTHGPSLIPGPTAPTARPVLPSVFPSARPPALPRLLPLLTLVGPDVVTVRTSQTAESRITTVLNRTTRQVRIIARISNASSFRLRTGSAWTCRALPTAPGTVAEQCLGGSSPVFSFDVSVADPRRPMSGRIYAADSQGSATVGVRVPSPVATGS